MLPHISLNGSSLVQVSLFLYCFLFSPAVVLYILIGVFFSHPSAPPLCSSLSLTLPLPPLIFLSSHFFLFQVNIMVLTRVVVITISTAKRRSIMLAMGTSPVEQAYEQMRYKPQGGAICPLFFFIKNTHWPSSLGADKL